MFDKFVRGSNPPAHSECIPETQETVFRFHGIQSVLDMDQVAPGFADADVGLCLAPGHSELGLVAEGALADVFADGFTAGLRLCLDGNPVLLRGTEGHSAGHVYLEIVGVKIFLFHNKGCYNSATDASLRAGFPAGSWTIAQRNCSTSAQLA